MALKSPWATIAAWFVASRLVIFAIGVVGVGSFLNQRSGVATESLAALNPEATWQKWDAEWYERIALHGYAYELESAKGQAAAAFFPLYPLTVRTVMTVLPGVSFFWAATILSNLFTSAALLLIVTSLVSFDDLRGRVLATIMTSAGSFYLSIPYSEGLFLLLVVGTMVATRARRYELAGVLAGLSAATRVHGLALVAVPAVACWLDRSLTARARFARSAATVALFAIPFLIYLAHLADVQGSWSAFVSRQELWDNPSPYPFQALTGFFHYPRRMTAWLHGAFWFLYVGLLIRYWRQMPLGEAVFCAGVFVISTQQEAFHGIYRYVVPLVPLTLALTQDRPEIQRRLIAINLIFGVLMILAFVTYNRITV